MESSKLIVLGTGKSGTHYVFRTFEALGFKTSHEKVFSVYGFNGWQDYDVAVSFAAVAYSEYFGDSFIYHVVRDPIKVLRTQLSSRAFEGGFWALEPDHPVVGPYVKFFYEHMPQLLEEKDVVSRAIRFIVLWNSWCENFAHKRSRVEDMTNFKELGEVCDILNINETNSDFPSIEKDKGTVDLKQFEWIEWDCILRHPLGESLAEMATKYGYEVK